MSRKIELEISTIDERLPNEGQICLAAHRTPFDDDPEIFICFDGVVRFSDGKFRDYSKHDFNGKEITGITHWTYYPVLIDITD